LLSFHVFVGDVCDLYHIFTHEGVGFDNEIICFFNVCFIGGGWFCCRMCVCKVYWCGLNLLLPFHVLTGDVGGLYDMFSREGVQNG